MQRNKWRKFNEMDIFESSREEEIENMKMEAPRPQNTSYPVTIEVGGDEFWPLSGKPYFSVILKKSHVAPIYQLNIPSKIHSLLPSRDIPVFISYKGKKWKMSYNGRRQCPKKLISSWKTFVLDNKLKVGDACAFELMECSEENISFRAQILRGESPSKFELKESGHSAETAILIV